MFCMSDPVADEATLATMSSTAARDHARPMLRQARRAEARTVFLAHRIGAAVFDDFLVKPARRKGLRDAADKAAVGEVSLQLEISRSLATEWISLADALRFLPQVRIAFLDGDFSVNRARIVAHTLTVLDEELRSAAEPEAIVLARRASADSTLRSQLEKLVIGLDPDAAAVARKDFADRHQDVKIRSDAFGHASIDATVPAEQGVFLKQKLAAMIEARVCRKDGRTIGQQRVAALAEMHGFPGSRLVCECGREDCPRRGAASAEVTVEDSADEATADEATADEAIAVEDDEYSPEALDAAIPLTGHDTQQGDADADTPETATESTDTEEVAAEPTEIDVPAPELTVVDGPSEAEAPALLGHGAIDPAHAQEIAEVTTRRKLPAGFIVVGDKPATPIDLTGHGGLVLPPKGALIYRPSTTLREQIMLVDDTCRYPFCGRPSHECQLDHLVKFDHTNPVDGGWTVAGNIIPLCTPDHHRKHLGLWIPTLYTDRTVVWRNPETGQEITTYPR